MEQMWLDKINLPWLEPIQVYNFCYLANNLFINQGNQGSNQGNQGQGGQNQNQGGNNQNQGGNLQGNNAQGQGQGNIQVNQVQN